MNNIDKIAFVDIETTGGKINYDRVIEIGIIRIEKDEVVDTYQTLINPEMYVSPFIEQMTNIHNEDLLCAPTFNEVKDKILERISDCTFVAHNVRFDYGFIKSELKRYGIQYEAKHFCTAVLSKLLYPSYSHHNLDSIIERFGFLCKNRHRAFDDAKVLWDFFQLIKRSTPSKKLSNVLSKALKKPTSANPHLFETIEKLPELPGVYIFYDEQMTPLYIGKSINIRERVKSHFSRDYTDNKEMKICSQTCSIETIITAGELGALLEESYLIKKLQPLYNRKLRNSHTLFCLVSNKTNNGYNSIEIVSMKQLSLDDLETVLGVFKSKSRAKDFLRLIAKDYNLCHKYLNLEKTNSSCFSNKLGVCKGACIGLEEPKEYNSRLMTALSKSRIKKWPYNGAIVISENYSEQQGQAFIIDNWCLKGKVNFDDSSSEYSEVSHESFDHDTYSIILRYLKSHPVKKIGKVIPYDQINRFLQSV